MLKKLHLIYSSFLSRGIKTLQIYASRHVQHSCKNYNINPIYVTRVLSFKNQPNELDCHPQKCHLNPLWVILKVLLLKPIIYTE